MSESVHQYDDLKADPHTFSRAVDVLLGVDPAFDCRRGVVFFRKLELMPALTDRDPL